MKRVVKFVDGKMVYNPSRSPEDARGGGKKLNFETAIVIFRAAHAPGARYREIGSRFGVTSQTVANIASGKSFAFLFGYEEIEGTGDYWIWEAATGKPRYRMTKGRRNKQSTKAVYTMAVPQPVVLPVPRTEVRERTQEEIDSYRLRTGAEPPEWWFMK